MRLGVGQRCITPPGTTDLSGFIARTQPATGVLDELQARALWCDDGREQLLWLHADIVGFMAERVAALRETLAAELGLPVRQIVCTATHTHAGPPTLWLRHCGALNPAYLDFLDDRLRGAAREARATAAPVALWRAEGRCTLGVDRRAPSPHAHTDPRVAVLAAQRPDGSYAAVLANYAVHHVGLSHDNRQVSADIAGAAAAHVQRALPGQPVTLLTNGACGNLNPRVMSASVAAMQAQGAELGAAVVAALATAQPLDTPTLSSVAGTLDLPLTILTPDGIAAEYARVLTPGDAALPLTPKVAAAYAEWQAEARALSLADTCDSVALPVQAVRVGPLVFAAVGGEVFSVMGDELRAACGPLTYVVGYANGDCGYIPPRALYAEGGYEVTDAYKFYAHFPVAPGGHERLRDLLITFIRNLRPGA